MHTCNTKNPIICRALVELAKSHDWQGSMLGDPTHPDNFGFLGIDTDLKEICGYSVYDGQNDTITIDEAIKYIIETPSATVMDFKLNGKPVLVDARQVVVGCTTVSRQQLCDIYNEMERLYNKEDQ